MIFLKNYLFISSTSIITRSTTPSRTDLRIAIEISRQVTNVVTRANHAFRTEFTKIAQFRRWRSSVIRVEPVGDFALSVVHDRLNALFFRIDPSNEMTLSFFDRVAHPLIIDANETVLKGPFVELQRNLLRILDGCAELRRGF